MKKIISVLLIAVMLLSFAACDSGKNDFDVVVITDIHFAGREHFDYEGYFAESNDTNGSGKQMKYLDDIFDAFIDEMKIRKPDYILITGDNTFDGAKESHLALAEKLQTLVDEGITILNIPGNHDIKSTAFIFPDGGFEETESVNNQKKENNILNDIVANVNNFMKPRESRNQQPNRPPQNQYTPHQPQPTLQTHQPI